MVEHLLYDICRELSDHCKEGRERVSPGWIVDNAVKLLQQYPNGISRPVLLTELEHKWMVAKRRGEHVGKLKQVIAAKQLSLSDVIVVDIEKLDEFRCYVSSSGARCQMIIHRQWFDWVLFLSSVGVDALSGRQCAITGCRMLQLETPVLLPTVTAIFLLRPEEEHENYLLNNVFLVLYESLWRKYVQHTLLESTCVWESTIVALKYMTRAGSLPNNSETLVILGEVLGCSSVKRYGVVEAEADGGSGSTEYQLVTLRLLIPPSVGMDAASACVIAYFILFDDQTDLTRLWNPGDQLLVYRPYLRANSDEGFVFGDVRDCQSSVTLQTPHSLDYVVKRSADPCLLDHVPLRRGLSSPQFATFHLLYGSVTVVAKLTGDALNSTVIPNQPQQPVTRISSVSINARVLCCRIYKNNFKKGLNCCVDVWAEALSMPTDGDEVSVGRNTSSDSSDYVGRTVVRVRFSRKYFELLCGSRDVAALWFSLPSENGDLPQVRRNSEESLKSPLFLTGHLVRFSHLHSANLSRVSSDPESYPDVVQKLLCKGALLLNYVSASDDPNVEVLSFDDPSNQITVAKTVQDCGVVRLSGISALACSPSLQLPITLFEANHLTGPSAGCVLVMALSIQPMHPSVRLLASKCIPSLVSGDTRKNEESSRKRPYEEVGVTGDMECGKSWEVKRGYQIVRLRDTTGNLLCIIESSVLLAARVGTVSSGTQEVGGNVVRVNQHMMNTSTSLFFDSSQGHMTRLNRGTGATDPAPHAVLLSRIDDGAECEVMEYLRTVQVERAMQQNLKQGVSPPESCNQAALPVFRIDAMCDASCVSFNKVVV